MTAYAQQSDVYKYGLPRGALGNPGRLVASSLAATSAIELCEHGFVLGDAVTFRATDGGTLSAPLVAGTLYYAVPINDSFFTLSSTPDGLTPITLSTDGVSMMVTADLPWDALLEFYSRIVDGFLPAHAVPLPTPYPLTVTGVVAQLVAKRAQILSGLTSESMKDTELAAKAQIERWAAGALPVRDAAATTQPANLSTVRSVRDDIIGGPRWGGRWPSDNGGFCP